ncbi:MAG: hypothetical protein ABIG56_05080 [Candidatus Omnitrophota bacterium]
MLKTRLFTLLIIFSTLSLVNPLLAQQDTSQIIEERVEDYLEEERGAVTTTAEEIVEMLMGRALRKLEDERRKQLLATKGTIGLHVAYDNNVNTDSSRTGDMYIEQYFAYSWTPTFFDELGAEVGMWYFGDWYSSNRDLTINDIAFNASLKWYPTGGPVFELQPGYEHAHLYYPYNEDSRYFEDKVFLKFKHRFWKRWSQDGKYEFSYKEYDTKQPRAGTSSGYVEGMALEKKRNSFDYNFGFPLGRNNLKLKNKFYLETSNDSYMDYYDLYSYKITGEFGRSLTQKLYMKLSGAFERKNYWHRMVASAQGNVAEFDDAYTYQTNFYYTLKKGWTLSYAFTYRKSDSNYAVYDYNSMNHKAGVYISF